MKAVGAGTTPKPQGLRPDAPHYAVRGPYVVGMRRFEIPATSESERSLNVIVWYPAHNREGLPEEYTYDMQFKPGKRPLWRVRGHAIGDAEPATTDEPFPLVVYSHAHCSFSQELPYFTEHLASRGFVVIAADHEDNWSTVSCPLDYRVEVRRPKEVTRQIDFAESLTAAAGSLPGMIATEKVGVAGWSFGGQTALAAAGARMNTAQLRAWCADNPASVQRHPWASADILNHEAELAAFAGLDRAPQGLWPAQRDARVGAVIALAPATILFGSGGMHSVDAPVMLMVGSGETAADPIFEMAQPYESVASERKVKVVFDHAAHFLFCSSSDDAPDLVDIGLHRVCSDPVWDMDRAHDLVNHFATAFLLAELKGDAEAAAALTPEKGSFPGIQYQSTGYRAAVETALDRTDQGGN